MKQKKKIMVMALAMMMTTAFLTGKETAYATEGGSENGIEIINEDGGTKTYEEKDGYTETSKWTLEENTIINGDLYFSGTSIDLNGKELIVKGHLYHTKGDLLIDGGTLEITGDYHLHKNDDNDAPSSSDGFIRMTTDADMVRICGSFYNYGKNVGYQTGNTFSAGTMYIGGNFYQYGVEAKNFLATHEVIFDGTDEQIVHFENAVENNFGTLKMLNNEKIKFTRNIPGFTLASDVVISGTDGVCTITGDINLAGNCLTIDGDLYQPSGAINMSDDASEIPGGTLEITGDYRLQEKDESGVYGSSKGYIKMLKPDDTVRIGGSFYNYGTNVGYLKYNMFDAGELYIGEDFYQYGEKNFQAGENHIVILNGTGKQIVRFEDYTNNGFNDLLIEGNQDVVFETPIKGWTLERNTVLKNGLPNGMVGELDLNNKTLIIEGDFYQKDGEININGGKLEVKGDLYQLSGAIDMSNDYTERGGTLEITGNYYLQGNKSIDNPIPSAGYIRMLKDDDTVRIGGSFYNYGEAAGDQRGNTFSKGAMYIGGNFYQYGEEVNNFAINTGTASTHKVILNGEREQIVKFENYTYNGFNDLLIEGNQDVVFESPIQGWKLERDTILKNGLPNGMVGEFNLNNKTLIVEGDLYQKEGKININSGILKVNGDLYQPAGAIDMSHDDAERGGILEITGNYYLQGNKNSDAPIPSAGYIRMLKDGDTVRIGGSFYNYGEAAGYQTGNTFSNGELYIGKDFYQYGDNIRNFAADIGGTHKVILNGEGEQTVHFAYPGDWSLGSKAFGNYFNKLELENSNVKFTSAVPGWTLTAEETILGNGLPNGMVGRFNLNGRTLIITGDLYQPTGGMDVNGGRLEVTGDYHLQIKDSSGSYLQPSGKYDNYSLGYIHMVNDKDYVKIGGDFYIGSGGSTRADSNIFEKGTMEIGGDLYQYGHTSVENFNADTLHTVILNGSDKQTVSFACIENSGFGNLILTKDKETDYVLPSKTCWVNLYQVIPQISVTPDNYVVQKGDLQPFTAEVEFADIEGKELPEGILLDSSVTWSVEGKTSASTTINASGELIVGADENTDTLTVKATSVLNPAKSASVEVIVGKMVSPDATGVKLAGHSLSLNGNIAVNFYMELPEAVRAVTDAYMHFTLPNGTTKDVAVSEAKQENGYYIFTCEVSAKEMTSEIKAQMFVNEKAGTEYLYAVEKYADYILSRQDVYGSKVVELVKAMLNYGAYSQTYFDYNTENPANAALTDAEKTLGAVSLNEEYKAVITGDEGLASFAATLVLKSETALNVYVKLGDGVAFEDAKFAIDYGIGAYTEVTPVKNGEYYVMTVEGINASNLDTMFKFKVSAEENVRVLTYGPMSYCYRILKEEVYQNELKLKDVVSALYHFNVAADNYRQ